MDYYDVAEADNHQSATSGFQYGGDTFADVNNLDHCIKYLNQSLTTFGFPSTLNPLSSDPGSVVQICNCLYALLQQRQRDIEFRDGANDQKQRLMSDMTRLEAKLERQDAQLIAKERELAALTSKEQKAATAFKAQLEKLQQEKDEFQRLVVSTQQVRVQQSHELKKKEKEYVKLQEKLNQVLAEKKKESKPALEILTLLQKEGRQRGTWNSKKADGDYYKMIIDTYEAKKQELMTENTDLRSLLRTMQSDMRDFLNTHNGMGKATSVNGSFDSDRPSTPLAGRTDLFDLPFHMARDQIEQSLRTKMASIKERMLQLQESQQALQSNKEASERELELEAQLVEARSIITEQVSLMNKQLAEDSRMSAPTHTSGNGVNSFLAADEDKVAREEPGTRLESDRSAMRKMTLDLDRKRIDGGNAEERFQEEQASWANTVNLLAGVSEGVKVLPGKNSRWPEIQTANLEVTKTVYEMSKNQTETQGSHIDDRLDRLKILVGLSEDELSDFGLVEPSTESHEKHKDLQYSLPQSHLNTEQVRKKCTGNADPRHDCRVQGSYQEQSCRGDTKSESGAKCVGSHTQAGSRFLRMLSETPTASRCSSSRFHDRSTARLGNGRILGIANHESQQNAVTDINLDRETDASHIADPDTSRISDRILCYRCKAFTEVERHQSGTEAAGAKVSNSLPHEVIRTRSQRLLGSNQEEQTRRPELAHSWSSSWRTSEPRIYPKLHAISDDAWVDDGQNLQTATSDLEIPYKTVDSRSNFSSWAEPSRENEQSRRSLSLSDAPSTLYSQKTKKDKQVSCGCFYIPLAFLRNKH